MKNTKQKKVLTIVTLFLLSIISVSAQLDTRTQNQIKAKFLNAQEYYDDGNYSESLEKVSEIEALTGGQLLAAAQNLKVKCLVGQGKYIKAKDELYILEGLNLSSIILKDIASYSDEIETFHKKEADALNKKIQDNIGKARFSYDNDYGTLKLDGKTGLIDKQGKVILPFEYDRISYYRDTDIFIWVIKNTRKGLIDKNNNIIIPIIYDDNDGLYSFAENGLCIIMLNGSWGAINKKNEVIVPFQFDEIYSFSYGFASVQKDGKWGFVDEKGRTIIPLVYQKADYFNSSGRAIVKLENKWGSINKINKIVVPFKYEDLNIFSKNGLAHAQLNGKYGFINIKDEVIIPFLYEEAKAFYNKETTSVKLDGKWLTINSKGVVVD